MSKPTVYDQMARYELLCEICVVGTFSYDILQGLLRLYDIIYSRYVFLSLQESLKDFFGSVSTSFYVTKSACLIRIRRNVNFLSAQPLLIPLARIR